MTRFALTIAVACTLIIFTDSVANDNPDFRYLEPDGMELPRGSFGLGIVIEPGYRLAFLTGQINASEECTGICRCVIA